MPKKKQTVSSKKVSKKLENSSVSDDTGDNSDNTLSDIEEHNISDIGKVKKYKTKKNKTKEKEIVIVKADPEELKKSLNYNMSFKSENTLSKDEYELNFNKLRAKYIQLCKEFSELQNNLKKKDDEREDILVQIRTLQKNNSSLITDELILNEKKDDSKTKNKTKNKNKTKTNDDIDNVNLIDRYKECNKDIILKPLRDTDMETEDSDSEELSESDSSDDNTSNSSK